MIDWRWFSLSTWAWARRKYPRRGWSRRTRTSRVGLRRWALSSTRCSNRKMCRWWRRRRRKIYRSSGWVLSRIIRRIKLLVRRRVNRLSHRAGQVLFTIDSQSRSRIRDRCQHPHHQKWIAGILTGIVSLRPLISYWKTKRATECSKLCILSHSKITNIKRSRA